VFPGVPVHDLVYVAPEARQAADELGIAGFLISHRSRVGAAGDAVVGGARPAGRPTWCWGALVLLDMLGSQPTPHEPAASADEPRSSSTW